MNARAHARLAALVLPLLPALARHGLLGPAERAELARLLGPPPPPWPYEGPPWSEPVAREDFPLRHLENDPFQPS